MIVIAGFALVAGFLALLALVCHALLVLADDQVPARGPLRGLVVARVSRRAAGGLDAEYRDLLRGRTAP